MKNNKNKDINQDVISKEASDKINENLEIAIEKLPLNKYIKPLVNQTKPENIKIVSEDEIKDTIKNKYGYRNDKETKELADKLKQDLDQLIESKKDLDTFIGTKEEEFSEEQLNNLIDKINSHFNKINSEFVKLVKEEEIIEPQPILKLKPGKPKKIKISKSIYKKIKAHCKENKVDINDWLEKITLSEINRVIIRLGDLDYKNIKKEKEKRIKSKI